MTNYEALKKEDKIINKIGYQQYIDRLRDILVEMDSKNGSPGMEKLYNQIFKN